MKGPKVSIQPPGPQAVSWIERYQASVCMPRWFNTVFSEAEGTYLRDLEGNTYMNLAAASANNLGFRHPEVLAAAREQMEATGIAKIHGVHPTLVVLAEKLKEIAPGALSKGRISFCNTGSDAAEFSMLLARAYTGRIILIAHLGAHHGFSMGARSLTADRAENRRFSLPLIPGVIHVPYPNCYRCSFGQEYPGCNLLCVDHIRHTFDTVAPPEETAAFFVEPVQAQNVVVPPKEYFQELKELCEAHEILLVDDEAMVGFGRTGKMWGIDHSNTEPDIMFLAKSIGSGMPMAAVLGSREIMEREEHLRMIRGGTFCGNLVACACALKQLEVTRREKLLDNAADVGEYLMEGLREISETHETIGDVRGKGLFIGMELVKDRMNKRPAAEETGRIVTEAFRRGLLLGISGTYRNIIRMIPPLILTKEEAETAVERPSK